MKMKIKIKMELESCDDCLYYEYVRCLGYDCFHADAPEVENREEEPLAENRKGNFPKWCPFLSIIRRK